MQKLGIKIDWRITYQSRVGPLKWLEPDTEEEIKSAAMNGLNIILVPIAFVSEHVETLVELDIEYGDIAKRYGIDYRRVPTLSTNKEFIKSLGEMVKKFVKNNEVEATSSELKRLCPAEFTKCICND